MQLNCEQILTAQLAEINIRTEVISPFSARTEIKLGTEIRNQFRVKTEITNRNFTIPEIRIRTEIIFCLRTEIELK